MWMEFLAAYASSAYASTGVMEMFLLTALLLWYFNPRVLAAMDVITTHFFHKYTPEWGDSSRVTQSSSLLRHKLTQDQPRAKERVFRERALEIANPGAIFASRRDEHWDVLSTPDRRPLVGLSCSECTPTSRKRETYEATSRVINVLNVKTLENPPRGFLGTIIPDIVHCCTFPKFTYPYIYETVVQDEKVKDAVEAAAQDLAGELNIKDTEAYLSLVAKQRERAVRILQNLRSTLSDVIIRLSAWVFLKTLPMMFSSMSCSVQQIEMLRQAANSGLPLIFLPLHRSHMDYIAVTLTLSVNGIRAPLVASGENLNIPVFGWILRGLGAFFIKRRLDPVSGKKDKVYRALLHTYLTQCISAGHDFEFFIEGRRSRSGKPSMPKGGLLSIFVDAYLSGVLQDALLVPVSVNCERLVDDSFLRELTGAPKAPESFTSAMSAIWSALTTHYGHIRIDFNEPFSLNELVKSFQFKAKYEISSKQSTLHVAPSTASLYGTDVVVEEQRQLVDSIARHILYDCCKSTAVMSTNAVAFLLLHEFRDGVMMDELVTAMDVLRGELRCSGKETGFNGDSLDVINHALKLLGPGLVRREKRNEGDFLKPVTILPNVIELNYYSNILLPHYALEGIVGTSLLVLANECQNKVKRDDLIDTCLSLCQILQFEFLFTKTCQSLNDALYETVDSMLTREVITHLVKPCNKPILDMQLDLIEDDDDEDDEPVKIPCAIYMVDRTNPRLVTYGKLVKSLIDTYYVTAYCLNTLVKTPSTERDFVTYVLTQIKHRFANNVLQFGESVSTESITNCVRLFEKLSVIDGFYQDGVKLLSLAEGYENKEFLAPVIERIRRFQT